MLRRFHRIFIHHQQTHKPGVRRKLWYILELAGSGQTTCDHFCDGWDFPPSADSTGCNAYNVFIILNCLFYHCLSKWREMGCQDHIPLVIQTACLASKNAYFCCPWTEIYSSPTIFAKCFLTKQNNSENKNKEELVTRKARVFQSDFFHTVISVGTTVLWIVYSKIKPWIASTTLSPSHVSRISFTEMNL